jgi:hypothetical protein
VSYSEAFDPDDPTLINRYPEYDIEKHLGDRPLTPTQQRENRYHIEITSDAISNIYHVLNIIDL